MIKAREHLRHAPSRQSRVEQPTFAPDSTAGQFVLLHSGAEVTEVPVTKERYARIANQKAALGKVVAKYADTAARAKQTGKPLIVSYRVLPNGSIEMVHETPAEKPKGPPLDAAIARAKSRGAVKVADILKGADMLTARDFGPLIGASHETVNIKRKRHEVLGLEGATRGVRYPRWQVTDSGLPLPGLTRLFEVLGEHPWTIYRFLRTSHAELGGRTALDALKTGQVEAVVGSAQNQAFGAFN